MALFGRGAPPRRDDDDLYGGYDEESNPLAGGRVMTAGPQTADNGAGYVGTSFVPPQSAFHHPFTQNQMMATPGMRGSTPGPPGSRMGTAMRLGTAIGGEDGRPMTSNKGAGFTSAPRNVFDPLQQAGFGGVGHAPALKSSEPSPEDQARDIEKKVHELLEESAKQAEIGEYALALERAKDAGKKERQLSKLREQQGTSEQMNLDLTFAVVFNLAHNYALNEMFVEALNAYTSIVKNKSFPQSGRLRVNMGNIYFQQRKFPMAIKMYRMALDQIPATSREVRYKIMRNIGMAFIRMGQYSDATQALENIMDNAADHQTGFNLVVCYHALGDMDRMKRAFQKLVESAPCKEEEEEEEEADENQDGTFRHDGLREELRQRQIETDRVLLLASQLVAPQIDQGNELVGFDWCIAQLNDSGHTRLANEVELAKASLFLSRQDFKSAITIFKDFEKKELGLKARAATNLSFLYFLESDLENAKKYAGLAVETDRYNALAWVNKGNVAMNRNDLEGSRADYCEALTAEVDCVEAIYNIGLINKKLSIQEENDGDRANLLSESLSTFKKLHSQLPDNMEVIYQIASLYELKQETQNAIKWFEILHSLVPNDAGISARLGAIYQATDDEARALHYYQESHRAFPANMDVISWLGAFHVRNEVYEKAVPYFALAAKLQPNEVKWELMVASCHRRVQNYPEALAKYRSIHSRHPDNVECLRYLVHICTELGRREEVADHAAKLRRAERAQGPATMAAAAGTPYTAQPDGGMAPSNPARMDSEDRFQIPAGPKLRKVVMQETKQDDDDWGDEGLGEDLLPM
ncbi:hypothetical protein BSKO_05186 [Bryopsis sp. KO-2023]|nr:hypothetical protein BSKO_05186 [Bryopsis sp. KO-2023]